MNAIHNLVVVVKYSSSPSFLHKLLLGESLLNWGGVSISEAFFQKTFHWNEYSAFI